MFVAENAKKEAIVAHDYQRGSERALYCPSCQGEVIYKQGPLTLPHFAHRKRVDCQSFSEGETPEHLAGKALLHQWLKGSQFEAYLPALKQRPDLLWGHLAVEFQCSPLPLPRLVERTTNYAQHDYLPFWLLGTRLQPKQKWTALQKACCYYQKETGIKLWALRVEEKEIHLYHQIHWHFKNGSHYEVQSFPLEYYSFKEILQTPIQRTKPIDWQIPQLKQQLKQKLFHLDPKILAIQARLYLEGGHLLYRFSSEKTHYFNGGMIARRYTVRM